MLGKWSLRQTAKQFWVLIDEFINGRKKGRRRCSPFLPEELNELSNGLLLLRREGPNYIGKVLGGHRCSTRSIQRLGVASPGNR